MIPNKLKLDQLPTGNYAVPEAPELNNQADTNTDQNPPLEALNNFQNIGDNDETNLSEFVETLTGERKFSADTIVDEEAGTIEIRSDSLPEQAPEMDEKTAYDNTSILMDLRETVQSYALSYFCDGNLKSAEQYDYSRDEKARLTRAWARVVGHYRIRVSPWVDVVVAEAVCTGPLVALAANNRKQRILIEKLSSENERLRQQSDKTGRGATDQKRKDTATAWKIDENGFFEYSLANSYIKKSNRTEKPVLTPENYELLIKHNGKDVVDKAFS